MTKFICMLTRSMIMGMDVSKLLQKNDEVEMWKDVPWDFYWNLKQEGFPMGMCQFTFDSKIYMVGGFRYLEGDHASSDEVENFHAVYQFDLALDDYGSHPRPQLTLTDSIHSPQGALSESQAAYISDDVYFVHNATMEEVAKLVVLDSTQKDWRPFPFPFELFSPFDGCYEVFVIDKMLFVYNSTSVRLGGKPLYCFNHQTKEWEVENDQQYLKDIMHSFSFEIDGQPRFCTPNISVSIPDFSSCSNSIMLAWREHNVGMLDLDVDPVTTLTVYAYCAKEKDVLYYQPLEEVFEGIQFSFNYVSDTFFLDLGNGMVSALISGIPSQHYGYVLCISVFTLTKAENFNSPIANTPPKKKRFLTVDVLKKRVYNLRIDDIAILDAFIFCSTQHSGSKKAKLDDGGSETSSSIVGVDSQHPLQFSV